MSDEFHAVDPAHDPASDVNLEPPNDDDDEDDDDESIWSDDDEGIDLDGYGHSEYSLAFCEIHHPRIHGGDRYTPRNRFTPPRGHWLSMWPLSVSNLLRGVHRWHSIALSESYILYTHHPRTAHHPDIRNFERILLHPRYSELQIVEVYDGPGEETLCVLKTFWIRILQRKWKRIFSERQRLIAYRSSVAVRRLIESSGYDRFVRHRRIGRVKGRVLLSSVVSSSSSSPHQ